MVIAAASAAVVAQPASSQSVGAGAKPCARLSSLRTLAGSASVSYNRTATGTVPASGPTARETIRLSRSASLGLNFRSNQSRVIPGVGPVTVLAGTANPRSISVGDHFATTNAPIVDGKASASGSAPNKGIALLLLLPGTCRYRLVVSFSRIVMYSGTAPKAGGIVSGSAITPWRAIPGRLPMTLSGSANVEAYSGGCTVGKLLNLDPVTVFGCYEYGGGWAADFTGLARCHSVVTTSCAPADKPIGHAEVVWHLSSLTAKS